MNRIFFKVYATIITYSYSREQRTENREQRTENREQRTENREQRTENREQKTENREQAINVSNTRTEIDKVSCIELDLYADKQVPLVDKLFSVMEYTQSAENVSQYSWIPLAVEAFVRAHSAINFSKITINFIQQTVSFQNANNLQETGDLNFSELEKLSVEKFFVHQGIEKASLQYSPAMNKAIEQLSPSAKYRWEIIATAAQEFKNNNFDENSNISVGVVHDQFFLPASGVGVKIVDTGREYNSQFSTTIQLPASQMKVTNDDVPLTEQEREYLEYANILLGNYSDKTLKQKEYDAYQREFALLPSSIGTLGDKINVRKQLTDWFKRTANPYLHRNELSKLAKITNPNQDKELPRNFIEELYRSKLFVNLGCEMTKFEEWEDLKNNAERKKAILQSM